MGQYFFLCFSFLLFFSLCSAASFLSPPEGKLFEPMDPIFFGHPWT